MNPFFPIVLLLVAPIAPGCDRGRKSAAPPAAAPPATSPAAGGERVRSLWLAGQGDAAADLLVDTDWAKHPSDAAAVISPLTEREFVALPPAQQQQRRSEMMNAAAVVRDLSRHLIQRAQARAAGGDHDAAERELEGLYRYGAAVCAEASTAKLTRLVGVAMQRDALTELVKLHESTGDKDKLAEARQRLRNAK